MYTVLVFGKIETWEKTFSNYYSAISYAESNKSKGFCVEIIESYY